jgi:hypothetical protein
MKNENSAEFQPKNGPRKMLMSRATNLFLVLLAGTALLCFGSFVRDSGAQVADTSESFPNHVCEKTTHQCSPGNGNDVINCPYGGVGDHCAFDFSEQGPDVTCTSIYEKGAQCTETWVACASWYAGTCTFYNASGDTTCMENKPQFLVKSTSLAIHCASKP